MNPFTQAANWMAALLTQEQERTPAKYGKRKLPTRVDQNQFTEVFVSQVSRLPVRAKQILMLDLYADQNLFLERFIDFLVNPIVGRQGFKIDVDIEAEETNNTIQRLLRFNRLDIPKTQRMFVRDYLLTGEQCYLKIPKPSRNTIQLVKIPAPVIRQTIVDPGNYNEVIAVEQEFGLEQTILHKVITDEDRLSPQAKAARSKMKFSCYLHQNCKRGYPTLSPYAQNDLFRKYEIRGEPYLMNSVDLLQALVTYLWKTMDKMDSWQIFNYKFEVETSGTEFADIKQELDEWADAIGKPEPNSAIFLPKGIMDMQPVTFPMHSTDLEQFYRMVRNATAWHGGTRETSMGEGEVRYASNEAPGVSEPSIETKEVLQRDQEDFLKFILDDVGQDAVAMGEISKDELLSDDPIELNYSIVSNEISKASQEGPTSAFEKFTKTAIEIKESRSATPASVHNAISQKGKELLAVELVAPEQAEPGEMGEEEDAANVVGIVVEPEKAERERETTESS